MKPSALLFVCLSAMLLTFNACGDKPDDKENTSDATEQNPAVTAPNTNLGANGKTLSEGLTEDYTHTDRVIWQKPDMVLNLLGGLDGKAVADIGAGTGFFTLRMAQKARKVIAIDIDPRFINYLDSIKMLELPEQFQSRIETRLGKPDDPQLKTGEVDLVVIVNTFMYIRDQVAYLKILRNALTPGGKILIVDFKRKRTPVGPPNDIRVPIHVVEEALYEAGYKNVLANDTALDYQYILVGER
ncbi:MAG: class I SAM-dependent methyltransferase [Saprospiraceae bacterium]|nr:class I SAM-dependent methyltransferase [Saprospiraceae bacterium]MDZ4703653.1 class I SAM-dependent methyltransferase [Saprospiraceae bacterium]